MDHLSAEAAVPAGNTRGMKIDLHVHCKERSNCGKSWAEEQISAAIDCGLDAIVFTDHDRLMPERDLHAFNERYFPFRIFGGIEVTVGDEHVIVLGIDDPFIEANTWDYPDLHRFVRKRRGFTALAHPFRYRDTINIDLETFPTDAIEFASNNTPEAAGRRIRGIASGLDVPVLCNSDSHIQSTIGRHYNVVHRVPADEAELIQLLKSGAFQCNVSPKDGRCMQK
jgi:predicted metal-dependent phosphoesterase TrpH